MSPTVRVFSAFGIWLLVAGTRVGALPETLESPLGATVLADSQPEDDPWGFEDEEAEVETWRSLLRDQALDLVLFVAFATLALVSFFRKSVGLKYVTLVAAVLYLGFSKSQLISVVNVYSVLTGRSSSTASHGICLRGSPSCQRCSGAASTAAAYAPSVQ